MAKTKSSVKSKKLKKEVFHISFSKHNYYIVGFGILIIIIGYIFMSENSVNGFMPTVIAPVLLVLGYCVVIPIGILYKPKTESDVNENGSDSVSDSKAKQKSSNIKVG